MKAFPYIVQLPRDSDMTAISHAIARAGNERTAVLVQAPLRACRQLLDTHDWRVQKSGQSLERWGSAGNMRLRLSTGAGLDDIIECVCAQAPDFAASLPSSVLRARLGGALGERRLLARCELHGSLQMMSLLDRREKTIASVEVWRPRRRGDLFVRVGSLRGYATRARCVAAHLCALPGAHDERIDPLMQAADELEIAPGHYPSWTLTPSQRAGCGISATERVDEVLIRLLAHYAQIMELNVQGMSDALDSEFLHQFRVGLRRSRALLRYSPQTLPKARLRPFVEYFAWLGTQTGPVRDADVHALVFPGYASTLGDDDRKALDPMMACLDDERELAHAQLAAMLASRQFRERWQSWLRFVHTAPARASHQAAGVQALERMAPAFVARLARQVVRRGRRIDRRSPPQSYHEVRKSCKNLRYIIDAYGFSVPKSPQKKALKRLSRLQALLGEHQDLDVHSRALQALHGRMSQRGILPGETHHAMEVLQVELGVRAQAARAAFAPEFKAFRRLRLSRSLAGKS